MGAKSYLIIVHDDGKPVEVLTQDGKLGILFPRASDDGEDMFYGEPSVNKAVFRVMPDGKEKFLIGGMTADEVRKEILSKDSHNYVPGCEDWDLVERNTVTFW